MNDDQLSPRISLRQYIQVDVPRRIFNEIDDSDQDDFLHLHLIYDETRCLPYVGKLKDYLEYICQIGKMATNWRLIEAPRGTNVISDKLHCLSLKDDGNVIGEMVIPDELMDEGAPYEEYWAETVAHYFEQWAASYSERKIAIHRRNDTVFV